ncbi:GntR family transcriptional regulator [Amycolatopsis suaedae]|uniref:GntR family transcriptional regulator n=1 Tax=Amycolatopsis suaedae TaxID=2510978 RepID=A0A4Q7J5L4_9PSEU|nr:GntR family transcriptional regulator [Amycolatopsis suaedae]RZQ61982.1 GntR family transcriptional regulator [Amycolatopsis suaedae]
MPEIQEVPPKYLQIANDIEQRIASGKLKPGDEVPSERKLALEWGVARPTASKALKALQDRGLVETRHGSGTFVRDPRGNRRWRPTFIDIARAENRAVEVVLSETTSPPAHVAGEFGSDEPVLCRRLIARAEDARPTGLLTTWYPSELAEQAVRLLTDVDPKDGAEAYLASLADRNPLSGRDRVAARLADDVECQRLGLTAPAAVLEHRLTVVDAKGVVVQYDEAVYPPDVWSLDQVHPFPS